MTAAGEATGIRVTRDDLLAAARLHHRATMGSRRTLAVVGGLALLVLGVVVMLAWPAEGAWATGLAAAAATVAYLYAIFLAVRYVRLPLAVRRQFREQRNLQEPHTLAWSERSYAVRCATAQSEMPWDHFLMWREDGRVLLLYQASKLFQMVPKRALPASAIDAIRGHLIRAGVPRGRLFLG